MTKLAKLKTARGEAIRTACYFLYGEPFWFDYDRMALKQIVRYKIIAE